VAGDEAEEAAVRHLRGQGWTILARNVRVGRSELDVLARGPSDPGVLVVVEVRSRSGPGFGAAVESVDEAKVKRLYEAAWRLRRAGRLPDGRRLPPYPWRIDLVTVERVDPSCPWRVTRHVRGIEPA
jgi:putative endonuclease